MSPFPQELKRFCEHYVYPQQAPNDGDVEMAIDVRSDDPCTATLISLQLRQAPVTEQSSQLQRTKRDNESTNQIVSCSISSTMPQSKRPIASLPIRAVANDANKTAQHPINQERTIAEPAQLIIGKREREQFLHDHHPERDAEESASKRHHDDDEW